MKQTYATKHWLTLSDVRTREQRVISQCESSWDCTRTPSGGFSAPATSKLIYFKWISIQMISLLLLSFILYCCCCTASGFSVAAQTRSQHLQNSHSHCHTHTMTHSSYPSCAPAAKNSENINASHAHLLLMAMRQMRLTPPPPSLAIVAQREGEVCLNKNHVHSDANDVCYAHCTRPPSVHQTQSTHTHTHPAKPPPLLLPLVRCHNISRDVPLRRIISFRN